MNARELRDLRTIALQKAAGLNEKAEKENRDFTPEEQKAYDDLLSEATSLENRYKRLEALGTVEGDEQPEVRGKAPAYNSKTKLGDDESKAFAHYFRTGDAGAVSNLVVNDEESKRSGKVAIEVKLPNHGEMRAVTDSTMNITTAADGKNVVPVPMVNRIAMRRGELMLADKLGVQRVPGKGTTVNFPFESADAQDFVTTSEQTDAHGNSSSRDAGQAGAKSFTLVNKTKKFELTNELLEDEDVNVLDWIGNLVGRGMALTHNAALIAEVVATGTLYKTFASATAIADGEAEDIVYNDTLSPYLDDGGAIAWVMRPSTYGAIRKISGDPRVYASALGAGRSLCEYPVEYSSKAAAIAAEAKSILFGNWYYMGLYESPTVRMIVDPYSVDNLTVLKYSFRLCYGQLIAGAIGYGALHAAG
jgi:HK97 family phage major capsid protein